MKCIYCNTEVNSEFNICPNCGKTLQIVPDYSVYDDDDINVLLESTKDVESKNNKAYIRAKREEEKKQKLEAAKRKQMKKTVTIVAICCICLLILGFGAKIIIDISNNNSYDHQMKLASGAMFKNNNSEAEKYFLRALELNPEDVKVRLELAELYTRMDKTDASILYLKDVLKLDATNKTAFSMLIDIYEELNDLNSILALRDSTKDSAVLTLFEAYMVDAPSIKTEGGIYANPISIYLAAGNNLTIYYTLDGTDPTINGIQYTGAKPIELSEEGTYVLKVVCKNKKGVYSPLVSESFQIKFEAPALPVVTPDGGVLLSKSDRITITVPDGCSAYYTWDRTDPTIHSTKYIAPITAPVGYNILSVIIIDDTTGLQSAIYRGAFEFEEE